MSATALPGGLKLDADVALRMRAEAIELLGQGQWERCRDIVLALVALGDIHPADPLMLAHSYRALGLHDEARLCFEHARRLHEAMGLPPPAFFARSA